MLKIREAQVDALGRAAEERFVEETLVALPSVFPGDPRVEDHHAMRALIRDGVRRAVEHGITASREVMLYVFLLVELGPDFEARSETRWIGRILGDPTLAPALKLDLVYKRLELAASRAEGT